MNQDDAIKSILEKYNRAEIEENKKLDAIKKQEKSLEKLNTLQSAYSNSKIKQRLDCKETIIYNADIIKSLEMAKARLRSRSVYSPLEPILEKAINNYKKDLVLCCADKNLNNSTHIIEEET
ncbi:uncharacterized protein LOC119689696 [Teleopsis dalmanni]|uniref:uncharacterized protein LOC119689696 n=1 Tax=Teleopsis dalmanni TaxID=139649 RepID=UPI0018CCBB07|nr:uncharacterized protein LOC119689696 [Teleopsis dalmanni]